MYIILSGVYNFVLSNDGENKEPTQDDYMSTLRLSDVFMFENIILIIATKLATFVGPARHGNNSSDEEKFIEESAPTKYPYPILLMLLIDFAIGCTSKISFVLWFCHFRLHPFHVAKVTEQNNNGSW